MKVTFAQIFGLSCEGLETHDGQKQRLFLGEGAAWAKAWACGSAGFGQSSVAGAPSVGTDGKRGCRGSLEPGNKGWNLENCADF